MPQSTDPRKALFLLTPILLLAGELTVAAQFEPVYRNRNPKPAPARNAPATPASPNSPTWRSLNSAPAPASAVQPTVQPVPSVRVRRNFTPTGSRFEPVYRNRSSLLSPAGLTLDTIAMPSSAVQFGVPNAAGSTPQPTVEFGEISARENVALRENLPIEHQQYLLYLYAKTGRADMAEHLARRVLADNPSHRDSLLAMTAMYIDKKQTDQALAYASTMYRHYPTDQEAAYYYGMANYLAGNYQEASHILQQLRLTQFTDRPFPYNVDLGQAALKAGNWERAIGAYRDLLDNNYVDDELRREVRNVLDQLYRRHLSLVETRGNAFILDRGRFYQAIVEGRHQLNRRTKIFAHAEHNQIKVEQTLVLRRRWNDANEIWAGMEYEVRPHMTLSGWAGGYNEGPQGGLKLMHRYAEKGDISVEAFGNEKARDSLLLQSLDGRQHRLTVAGSYYLTPRFLVFGQLGGRQVHLDGAEIGRAINASWNAEFFIRREGPIFRVGYRGLASSFGQEIDNTAVLLPAVLPGTPVAAQTPLLNQFVLNRIHREGVYVDWLSRLYGPVFIHGLVGADYAFEQNAPEYYGRLGFRVYPRRSLELLAELGYISSVATADGASGQWEINVALRYWF